MNRGFAILAGAVAYASACTTPSYEDVTAPYACVSNTVCPEGFECQSGVCVRAGSARLPDLLARSAAPINPQSHPDPDRGGVVTCWAPAEASGSAHASVFGGFIGHDGVVHGPVRFVEIDATNSSVSATCAPIPDSGGRVLVALAVEPLAALETTPPGRLSVFVWTPDETNGFEGRADTIYEELALTQTPAATRGIRAAVVGREAWVPIAWRKRDLAETVRGFPLDVSLLRVGAPEVASWRPVRTSVVTTNPIFSDTTASLTAGSNGAWALLGHVYSQIGYFTPRGPVLNVPEQGYPATDVLASNQVTTMSGSRVEEAALLWTNPLDNRAAITYRVAWKTPLAIQPRVGPVVPFYRSNTIRPGSFRIDNDLYIVGAPIGPMVPPASLDAGVDAASDATAGADVALGDASVMQGPLTIYRVPWGADSGAEWTFVTEVAPRVTASQVTEVAAVPMPDDSNSIGLSWVEFYPSDRAGNGARYVLYAKRQNLR